MRRFPANDTGVYPTPKDPKTPGFAFVAILPLICQEIQLIAQINISQSNYKIIKENESKEN